MTAQQTPDPDIFGGPEREYVILFMPFRHHSKTEYALHYWIVTGREPAYRHIRTTKVSRHTATIFKFHAGMLEPQVPPELLAEVDDLNARGIPVNVPFGWRDGGWES